MKLKEIYDFLDKLSPFELQESWDNSGLIVGEKEQEVEQIVVSIDIDEVMIEKFSQNTLFLVHHPLIFKGLKRLDFSKYPANLIEKLIKKDQMLLAMHTNFDKTHLNRYVFEEVLGFCLDEEKDFICISKETFNGKELIQKIKQSFNLEHLRVVNFKEKINGVALTTGSGGSLIDFIDVDCYLTGDIKYHDAMKALSEGKMLCDIGHFESERFFANIMQNLLKTLPISVIITQSQNPFQIL